MSESKRWCFTYHTGGVKMYKPDLHFDQWKYVDFLIVGEETCPTTGRIHYQGYVEWTSKRKLTVLKKLSPTIHWETAKGTAQQNIDYCSKENKLVIVKGRPACGQGHRSDLDEIKSLLDEGKDMLTVAEEHFGAFCRYGRAFKEYKNLKMLDRKQPPLVSWYWGLSGAGKTRKAVEFFENGEFYIKDGTQWWDGYETFQGIIIDDFDGRWPFRDLLRLLDRYPYQGQIKGGYVKINCTHIFITCEFPPQHFWFGNELEQILRRLTFVEEIKITPEVAG